MKCSLVLTALHPQDTGCSQRKSIFFPKTVDIVWSSSFTVGACDTYLKFDLFTTSPHYGELADVFISTNWLRFLSYFFKILRDYSAGFLTIEGFRNFTGISKASVGFFYFWRTSWLRGDPRAAIASPDFKKTSVLQQSLQNLGYPKFSTKKHQEQPAHVWVSSTS